MRIITILAMILLILSGCPYGPGRIYDSFLGQDMTLPKVLSYGLEDNQTFKIVYDRVVYLADAELDGRKLKGNMEGSIFDIRLSRTLSRGERAILSVTAETEIGNTLRSSFIVIGRNEDIPHTVINEASIQGTGDAPDRVELLFLEEGNTAGMVLRDGTAEGANHSYYLPQIDVQPGDMLLIYWNAEHTGDDTVSGNGHTTHIADAGSDTTLSGTNGTLILYAEENGDIMDGMVYTTGDNPNSDGYGNDRTRDAARLLREEGQWAGEPIDSNLVTSSRVLARLPGGWDTNTSEDFFITEPRKSTFGYPNEYFPYEP